MRTQRWLLRTLCLVAALATTAVHSDLVTLRDNDYIDDVDELGPSPSDLERQQAVGNTAAVQCARDTTDGSIVCDCGDAESLRLSALPTFGENFRIRNCRHLHIPNGAFASTRFVRSVHISNVRRLTLEQGSLQFAVTRTDRQQQQQLQPRGISLVFRDVHIPTLGSHSVQGNLEQVLFDGCQLGDVHAFAITPTHDMLALTVQNTVVEQLARHVLKKFVVGQMALVNCTFVQAVPSGAVREVAVTEGLRIVGSVFGEVLPNAFQFETVRAFDLMNNRIQTLNGSSFHMTIADRCTVTGNNITEISSTTFLAITSTFPIRPQANLHFQPPEFRLTDNRLGNVAPLDVRLRFADAAFNVQVAHLLLLTPITCDLLDRHQSTEFQRTHADALYLRTCADCTELSYTNLREHQCRADRTLAFVAAGVAVMVLLLVVTVLLVWWLHRRRREALARMQVVQPEARTYRETQIVIQIENAGLLKTDL